jgi:hypothetical protein
MRLLKHLKLTVALALAALIMWALWPLTASANPETLEVTAPSPITLGSLYGATGYATGTSSTSGTVLCEGYANGYTLKINSNKADGIMQEPGNQKLANALLVTADLVDGTGASATQVIADDVTVTTGLQEVGHTTASSSGTNNIALSVKQAKQITGVPGATYSLTLTFTASVN